jgi:hypothetical protein
VSEDRQMKRKAIFTAIINISALLIFSVLLLISNSVKDSMKSQQTAEEWAAQGDTRFSQVSCFTSESSALTKDMLTKASYQIDEKLKQASINPYISEDSHQRIWTYAYSKSAKLTVKNENKSTEANAVVAGGDFFVFHPVKMLSGYYFSPDDLMQDRIVIDEDLAWQMFGSKNVVGMTLQIKDRTFLVAGVSSKPSDNISKLTYGKEPKVYISYDAYADIFPDNNSITCFEACIPNPVDSFAKDTVKSTIGLDESKIKLVENTNRYSFINMIKFIKSFAKRYIDDSEIYYPFWENSARVAEGRLSLLTALQIVFALPTVITVVVLIIAGCRAVKKHWKNALKRIFNIPKKNKKRKGTASEHNENDKNTDTKSEDKKVLIEKT